MSLFLIVVLAFGGIAQLGHLANAASPVVINFVSIIVAGSMGASFFSTIVVPAIKRFRNAKGQEKGIENKINYLKTTLTNSKKRLNQLENDSSKEKEQELVISAPVMVDDAQQLQTLKNEALFQYWLGLNENKLLKWYHQGVLREYLAGRDNTEIDIIEAYISEIAVASVNQVVVNKEKSCEMASWKKTRKF